MLRRPSRQNADGSRTVVLRFDEFVAERPLTLTLANIPDKARYASPFVVWAALDLLRAFTEISAVRLGRYDFEWDLPANVSAQRESRMVSMVRLQSQASDLLVEPETVVSEAPAQPALR